LNRGEPRSIAVVARTRDDSAGEIDVFFEVVRFGAEQNGTLGMNGLARSITSKEDMSPSASPRNCGAKIAERAAAGGLVQR